MECSICYENITKETGKAELSCSHSFHLKCLSQWFIKNENCPCCRHEANETEKMVPMNEGAEDAEESEDESMYDEEEEDDERDESEIEASRKRAQHMFRLKRWDMKNSDFEAYAATRISALVRGYQSRIFFFQLKCWKEDEKDAREAAQQAEIDFKKAQSAQNFYKKLASMTRPQWKTFAATMIQAKWRSKKQQGIYKKEKLAREMEAGFKVHIDVS